MSVHDGLNESSRTFLICSCATTDCTIGKQSVVRLTILGGKKDDQTTNL